MLRGCGVLRGCRVLRGCEALRGCRVLRGVRSAEGVPHLPLAEGVVCGVAELVGGVHGPRPAACGGVVILHEEGVASRDLSRGEDAHLGSAWVVGSG